MHPAPLMKRQGPIRHRGDGKWNFNPGVKRVKLRGADACKHVQKGLDDGRSLQETPEQRRINISDDSTVRRLLCSLEPPGLFQDFQGSILSLVEFDFRRRELRGSVLVSHELQNES